MRLDKLGVPIALIVGFGALIAPFATFRPNRIAQGEGRGITEALPTGLALVLALVLVVAVAIALARSPAGTRLAASTLAIITLALLIGQAGTWLTPTDDRYARVAPASGFLLMMFGFALMLADAITRLRLGPMARVGALVVAVAAVAALLGTGQWDSLSVMKEYASRADAFWTEAVRHLALAVGSLCAAVLAGVPLGILCHRVPRVKGFVLNLLNMIQTIPSIALFGLLIGPLAWIAANVPLASSLGIKGIGAAPAFVALFLYSLLPVVSNTVVGLTGVSPAANDAARGVGMTDWRRLSSVEMPLAFPVILTGIRIVLVQNIGLATIAALIGGGGFGVFVFQGIGQTAMDLVLLGAVPTVALAFAAAVLLDAATELVQIAPGRTRTA